ncbi:Leucine repeat adapter protein 25 [Frankliniella fusca]|uniref:Leucine repeat adapter protein 25 n=1 Tax=Frankliniella fusca TaxID=407009 RepID=A0AAE1HN52_9NEOP|nr:Leucine repeat adapter protein 25 [Frankliniella fusca]
MQATYRAVRGSHVDTASTWSWCAWCRAPSSASASTGTSSTRVSSERKRSGSVHELALLEPLPSGPGGLHSATGLSMSYTTRSRSKRTRTKACMAMSGPEAAGAYVVGTGCGAGGPGPGSPGCICTACACAMGPCGLGDCTGPGGGAGAGAGGGGVASPGLASCCSSLSERMPAWFTPWMTGTLVSGLMGTAEMEGGMPGATMWDGVFICAGRAVMTPGPFLVLGVMVTDGPCGPGSLGAPPGTVGVMLPPHHRHLKPELPYSWQPGLWFVLEQGHLNQNLTYPVSLEPAMDIMI